MQQYAKTVLFKELDTMVELGGDQEIHRIAKISKHDANKFVNNFITDNAFKFRSPVVSATINRYMEQWLVKQYNKFNK